jgi:midasin
MQSVSASLVNNEPTLLCGETGCGKTTIVQHLAHLTGRNLIVQNLSLQTDSADLLGGYRPLEIKHLARPLYEEFVALFVSHFSRSSNEKFLTFVKAAMDKKDWKKLSQCFVKAAKMGLAKIKPSKNAKKSGETSPQTNSLRKWEKFAGSAKKFEVSRSTPSTPTPTQYLLTPPSPPFSARE